MPRTLSASLLALLIACLACALVPMAAGAQDGGAGFGTPTGTPADLAPAAPEAEPVPTPSRVVAEPSDGPGGTLLVRSAVTVNNRLRIRGTMDDHRSGRSVSVERRLKDGRWKQVARTRTKTGGTFSASWKTDHTGEYTLRAVHTAARTRANTARASATGTTAVRVYRRSAATFYGPGFYGNKTACGQTLTETTIGVAHRTLPCGTMVDLYSGGRHFTVPVIDRGPFHKGIVWDLTSATAEAIGFPGSGTIAALRLPRAGSTKKR